MKKYTLLYKLKEYDKETYLHSLRVAKLTLKLIENELFDKEEREKIYWAALLHDIGKMNIKREVLFTKSIFTEAEFNEMKKHARYGHDIIISEIGDEKIARIVLEHHERNDGSGYPEHKEKGNILTESKIIAIADSYDAMSSKRRYKESLGLDKILNEFQSIKNQYDDYYLKKLFKLKGYTEDKE